MRSILIAAALVLAFAIVPVAAAEPGDGPDPSGCRPYCVDDAPTPDQLFPGIFGPEPTGCRPYC